MTMQGQEIMNRLAILPPTGYGDYRFKRDIKNVISGVLGTTTMTDRTLQRMTDLGLLTWSRTGRMAKVYRAEPTYCVRVHGLSIGSGLCETDAYQIAEDYGLDEAMVVEE